MTALLSILWFLGLIAVYLFNQHVGAMYAMIRMFPEGRRWYILPLHLLSLALLAVLVRYNPF